MIIKHINVTIVIPLILFPFAMASVKFPLCEQFNLESNLLNMSCLSSVSLGDFLSEKNLSSQ